MENKKYFKLKVIDSESKASIVITLDCSRLCTEGIQQMRKITPLCTQVVTKGDNRLIFIGDRNCKLELETIYNFTSFVQTILSDSLTWDIIDEIPVEDKDIEDLNGYLILNTTL